MAKDDAFAQTSITLVDGWDFEPSNVAAGTSVGNPRAANYDTSRIIRSEYPHGPYAALAREAHSQWRGAWGADGRYVERRLLLCAQGSSLTGPKQPGETVNYVKNAYNLSCQLSPGGKESLKVLDSLYQIRAELGAQNSLATADDQQEPEQLTSLRGYISQDSGWADSGASMAWLRQKLVATGRVRTCTGYVKSLIYASGGPGAGAPSAQVEGVRLEDGKELRADLVIVAAGSHTPRLLEMDKMCDVYSEVIAYIQLSPEECTYFKKLDVPILVNASRCVFAIAPDREGFLKLGKFSHSGRVDVRQCAGIVVGPRSRSKTPREEWSDNSFGWGGDVESGTEPDERARETLADYRAFLNELFNSPGKKEAENDVFRDISRRPFVRIRRCYYTDTPSTDFIVDYHPHSAGTLFVASGGSDHAFKFLPVIGDKVAGIVLRGRSVPCKADGDANLTALREAWRFPRVATAQSHL